MDPNQQPPKFREFNARLKSLCTEFQYELIARPFIRPDGGIAATIEAIDAVPAKDEGVPLTPSFEAPNPNETPAPTPETTAPSVEEIAAAPVEEAKKNEDSSTESVPSEENTSDGNSPVDNSSTN